MADLHVKNTGSSTSPFDTWAKAAATLGGVTGAAAGDRYLVSSAHSATPATVSIAFPGTAANPNQIIGGTEGTTSGLTALATGAKEVISGTTFSLTGSFYMENIQWEFSSASSFSPSLGGGAGNVQRFKGCSFRYTGAAGSPSLLIGSGGTATHSYVRMDNCTFKCAQTSFFLGINRRVDIHNGSWESGGASPSYLFYLCYGNRPAELNVRGFDASNVGTSTNIIGNISEGAGKANIRGMKLPTSWAGSLVASGQIKAGTRVEMLDYQIGTTLYKAWIEEYGGQIKSETTVKLSTDFSYKCVTSANVKYPNSVLTLPEFYVNLTGGASKTVTLNLLTDNVTLNNDDVILEAEFFGTSGSYLPSAGNSGPSDVLATNAALSTNTASWTTTGLTTPVNQQVSITFTPNQDGFAVIRARICKPSTTVYVDNKVTVA